MIAKIKVGAAISAAIMLCASFVTQAVAEDCHRGTLDEAYCCLLYTSPSPRDPM